MKNSFLFVILLFSGALFISSKAEARHNHHCRSNFSVGFQTACQSAYVPVYNYYPAQPVYAQPVVYSQPVVYAQPVYAQPVVYQPVAYYPRARPVFAPSTSFRFSWFF